MKKILVIGGGGFIGSHIVDGLLSKGYPIRILERENVKPYRFFEERENVEWMKGDFLNLNDIACAMENVDAVYHLVSTTLPKNSNENPIYDVQTNIVGSLQVLNAMISFDVKKIIFISSGGTVYGSPNTIPIDESHTTNPIVSYGVTKLAIEKYLMLYENLYGLKPIILRVSNPFGERQRVEGSQGAIGIFIAKALKDLPVEIWGNGGVVRDYIYIADVANAFVSALNYTGSHNIFNVSSGVGLNLNELLESLEGILGIRIKRVYHPPRPYDVPVNIISNKLIKDELNWKQLYTHDDALRRTVNWMKLQMSQQETVF